MICRGSEVNATRAIGDQSDQTTEHERTEVETRGDPDAKRRCDARRQRYRSRRVSHHTQVRTASKTPHDPETWHAVNVSMKILNEAIQRHSLTVFPRQHRRIHDSAPLLLHLTTTTAAYNKYTLADTHCHAWPSCSPTLTPRHSPHATIDTAETIHLGHVGMQPTSAQSHRG